MTTDTQLANADLFASEPSTPANLFALWWGILIGPVAWAADLGLSYSMTQGLCALHNYWVLHLITVVTLALSLSGILLARHELALIPQPLENRPLSPIARSRFMAWLGMALSLMFSIAMLALMIPGLGAHPCQ